jgi:alpha-beta hydrolase superfamily lysophospholipase
MQYSKTLFSLLLALSFQGCTSLFFYPDDITYRTPEFYELKYDDVYFKSKDKTLLHAWHIYPQEESKGLIFVAHGNAQNLSSHFISWVWLIEEGYEIFIFDYRGYGKSEGKIDLKGSIEDTFSALSYVENSYDKEYFACGQSLGGSLLLNALDGRDNTKVKAVIIDSTFTGFSDIVNAKLDSFWLTWPFQWIPYLTLSNKYDAKDRVVSLGKPVLFLHGSLDTTVSPNNSWQLFELSTMPREFWIVKNKDHTQALENENAQKDFLEFLQDEKNFYDKNYSRMRIYE